MAQLWSTFLESALYAYTPGSRQKAGVKKQNKNPEAREPLTEDQAQTPHT